MTICDGCRNECFDEGCDECGGDYCDRCLSKCACGGHYCSDCKKQHYVRVEEDGHPFYDLCPQMNEDVKSA